jgi:hypothetical protein
LGVGITTLTRKNKIVQKPPRNSAGFCGGGQRLSWAVEPSKEEEEEEEEEEERRRGRKWWEAGGRRLHKEELHNL